MIAEAANPQPSFGDVVSYWDSVEPSVNGVLGGYDGRTPRVDELCSRMLLLNLKPSLSTILPPHLPPSESSKHQRQLTKCLDVGAGIGRVTCNILLPLFDRVDMVESSSHFLDKAIESSSTWTGVTDKSKGVKFWCCGMQDFDLQNPPKDHLYSAVGAEDGWNQKYDVVWIHWCIGHFTDTEIVRLLIQSKAALKPDTTDGAYVIVKDNVAKDEDLFDATDSSLMRTESRLIALFNQAGLKVLRQELQTNLDPVLLPVKTFVLQ